MRFQLSRATKEVKVNDNVWSIRNTIPSPVLSEGILLDVDFAFSFDTPAAT